jgi:hypothetical protein
MRASPKLEAAADARTLCRTRSQQETEKSSTMKIGFVVLRCITMLGAPGYARSPAEGVCTGREGGRHASGRSHA